MKHCRNFSCNRNKIYSYFDIKITCLILVYIPWRRNCGGWWCNKHSIGSTRTFLFIFFVAHDAKTCFIERTIILLECVFLSDFEVTLNTTFITYIIQYQICVLSKWSADAHKLYELYFFPFVAWKAAIASIFCLFMKGRTMI